MNESKKCVGIIEKLVYGSGDVGLNAMYTLFSTYVLFFYTDVIGFSPAIAGVIILVSKLLDGVSDLIAGQYIDTHKGAKGHCIPILAKWIIPMVLSVTLVFLVPHSMLAVQTLFIFVTYNLFNTVVYTLVNAAHAGLASYATDDDHDRAQMLVYKMMFSALTQTIMASVMLPMVEFFGGQQSQAAWIKSVLAFGAVGAVFLYLNVFVVKERVDNPAPPENLSGSIKCALTNKYWVISVLICILSNFFLLNNLSVSVYYLNVVMGNLGLMGSWVAVSNLPGIPIALLIPNILKIKGMTQQKLVIFGAVLMGIGQVLFIVLPHTVPVLLITGAIKACGFGFPMGMSTALIAETIDYGEWKTGTRIQSMLLAGGGVGGKIGQGLMTSLFGFFLTSIGYIGTAATQVDSAVNGINAFFLYAPAIIVAVMLILAFMFDVEKKNPQIQKELVERRGPLT